MPTLIVVLTVLVGLPGLVLGALTVRDWDPRNDPDYLRDTVQQGAVAFLKIGLLLLLLCVGVIAVVGALAAHRSGTTMVFGIWFCAVATWLLGAGFVLSWTRRRRRDRTHERTTT